MENPTILVADGDPKNLQILRENLESSGFEVIVAADGLQAWQKISAGLPDLILSEVNLPQLDGFQLLEKLKADPATSAIPMMFLTNRRELQDRVRSLRGGVKDYMIKPLHVKEVLARIRMILRRMERLKEDEVETAHKLVGRLEEFSPVDLIESFGVERKTGMLTLRNENNRTGEVYFREGAVVNATLGNLKAEKAVYQMLPWKHGHFTMIFKEISVPDEISVSNLGLLLQGFKRMEERERLFKLLPSPETTFVTTETFRSILTKRELAPEVAKFISLIDGRHDILQIIDESTYDDIKSLERLVKLYQQGFVKPGKSAAPPAAESPDLAQTLAEPKIVQKMITGGEAAVPKATAPAAEKPRVADKPAAPAAARPAILTPPPAPLDLPPFRPSVKLPPPFEQSPFASAEAKGAETKKEEKQETRTPAPANPAPVLPPNPPEPPAAEPETVELELPPASLEPPEMEQIEGIETSAKKNGNENLWPDAGMTPAVPESHTEIDEKDLIEIREADDDEPSDPASTAEIDRILRTIGRGLSPEYVEPELLPLDLNELMQRPMAPPPFAKHESVAENGPAAIGTAAPGMRKEPAAIEAHSPLPAAKNTVSPPPLVPEDHFLAGAAEEEIFSPIVDLRKHRAGEAKSIEASSALPESAAAPEAPAPDLPALPRQAPEREAAPASAQEHENDFAQNLYDIPREIIPEFVDVEKMERQTEAMAAAAPAPTAELPAVSAPIVPPQPPAPRVESQAPTSATAPANWHSEISTQLVRLAQFRHVERPKLVVIGRESLHISALVKNLLGPESSLRKVASATFQHLELGERKVGTAQPFDLIGISIEQQFTKLLATIAKDLAGYLMLVEAQRRQDFAYLGYLLQTLRASYRVPAGIAVVRAKDQKNISCETVRDLLNADTEFVEECNPFDTGSVAAFMQGLCRETTLARWADPA